VQKSGAVPKGWVQWNKELMLEAEFLDQVNQNKIAQVQLWEAVWPMDLAPVSDRICRWCGDGDGSEDLNPIMTSHLSAKLVNKPHFPTAEAPSEWEHPTCVRDYVYLTGMARSVLE
jgi:hypothetical protein